MPRTKHGGRRPGTPNRASHALRRRIEAEADPIAFLVSVMRGEAINNEIPTMSMRIAAAKVLADKLCPNARSAPIALELPAIETAADLPRATGAIVQAVALGTIKPDEGETLAGIVEQHRKALETADLAERIQKLESRR